MTGNVAERVSRHSREAHVVYALERELHDAYSRARHVASLYPSAAACRLRDRLHRDWCNTMQKRLRIMRGEREIKRYFGVDVE